MILVKMNIIKYNKEYIKEQNELIIESYESIKTIRILFANHPVVKDYKVPDWLNKQ